MAIHSEVLLISAVIKTGEYQVLAAKGITGAFFHVCTDEWDWIEKYIQRNSKAPSKTAFRQTFPNFTIYKVDDTEHWCDEVRKSHTRQSLVDIMENSLVLLDAGDENAALANLMIGGNKVQVEQGGINSDFDVFEDWEQVYDSVSARVDRVRTKGWAGVPSGFSTFDHITGGWQAGWLGIMAARLGQGKAITDDTLVLTPFGWTRNGHLTAGDQVIGSSGEPTTVLAVYPQGDKQVYKVQFSDGSVIETADDHLWTVRIGAKPWKTQTTLQVMEHLSQGRQRPSVPTMQPWKRPDAVLPVDPYVLGLLLGDGGLTHHRGGVAFSSADEQLVAAFGSAAKHYSRYDYGITGYGNALRSLGLMGHRSETKFVPDVYLHASVEQRHALLQGLLDTDGGATKSGGIEFSSTSENLARGVQFLAESLGGHAHFHRRQTSCNGKPGLPSYRLIVVLPPAYAPFRLRRKAEAYVPRTKYQPARSIASVTPVDRFVPMTCINVEAADSLYVTEHCIVTHNTWTGVRMAYAGAITGHKVTYYSLEQSRFQIASRVHAFGSRQYAKSPFNPMDLNKGTGFDLREYKKFLQEMRDKKGTGRFTINDTSRGIVTPSVVAAGIESGQPDIVFIDYLTLLGANSDDWRGTAKLSSELQAIANRYAIPIVAMSQVNRLGIGKEPPGAEHLSQADAIGQDADVVLTMTQKSQGVMKMRLAKFRHGPGGATWHAKFSPGTGEYEEVTESEAETLLAADNEED